MTGTRLPPAEDLRPLSESAERFVREHFPYPVWRRRAREQSTSDRETWRQMADLGWLGIGIPEAYGGLGLSARERNVLMEAIGAGLVLEPYWSSAVLCADLLGLAGTEEQKLEWLPKIATGSARGALALLERDTGHDWRGVACCARRVDQGWTLYGDKLAVIDAPLSDWLIVLARTSRQSGDLDGLSLFWVPSAAQGISREDYRTLDERRASDLVLDGLFVPQSHLIGTEGRAGAAVAKAIDHAILALCAEAVGAMSSAVTATIQHLKTRRQFGRPLAEFQVLRHRVADMVVALEQSRSIAMQCTQALGETPRERTRLASVAKSQIGTAGRFIGESAVQLHGGMGVTDDLQVGHFLKRLLVIDMLLGDSRHHLARLDELKPDQAPEFL
jgi:alkylation response protein AidB-like acyl-CoA dehydrogenase